MYNARGLNKFNFAMSDETKLTPAMAQYKKIKEEHKEYLLFYRMGDFYELFYDDAIVAAKVLDITLTKKTVGVPMCGVPFHAYESYLAKLIKNGYKVAICEQMETPEEAKKRGGKAIVRREVVRLVTSGTLTEDSLLDARKNNYLFAFLLNSANLDAAWVDLSTGVFYTQHIDVKAENTAFEVSTLLSRLQPSEILISDSLLQNPQIFAVLNEYKKQLTVLPAARFNFLGAQKQILNFYQITTLDSFGKFTKGEVSACGVLLDYIATTQRGKCPRIEYPVKLINSTIMEIDAVTRKSLDLISNDKANNLLKVIDCTVSGFGARLLAARLANPLLDVEQISKRQDAVEFFVCSRDARENVRKILHECADLERIISRLSVGRGGPRDLEAVGKTLAVLSDVKNAVTMHQTSALDAQLPQAITQILQEIHNHSALADKLLSALKEDLPNTARDGGFIRKGYSPDLDGVHNTSANKTQAIAALQEKYSKQTGISGLKIKENSLIGYFIEVPAKYATDMLEKPEFIHRQSILNAVRFTTVELNELDNYIRGTQGRALEIELEIFNDLVNSVMIEAKKIVQTAQALAELDVAASMAELALENNYCRPKVDNSLVFEIQEGRHPVVEYALKQDNMANFVANDCFLDTKDNRIWLLTGPNMAGKSTFLRQNAIIAIMAQMGIFVPAKSAHIGVVDKVFSRVGASDDLARGRSTFMVEMVETAAILHRAGERSFVILDEIGRGTATFDGLSIAWAVVEYLHNENKSRCLFATHYHELAAIAEKLEALSLHCMKIKDLHDKVVFLHEVVEGNTDRSYGIHVAKLAGLPHTLLARAEAVLQNLERTNQNKISVDENELPLFSFAIKQEQKKYSQIEEKIAALDTNNMTPREALQTIYDLQELIKKGQINGN